MGAAPAVTVAAIGAAPAVTIVAVALTVAVIAIYLILIAIILKKVFGRLETILGAVSDVTVKSAPAGEVIAAISSDLAAGHRALDDAVERLRERTADDADQGLAPAPPRRGGSVAVAPPPRGGSVADDPGPGRGGWWQR
jgi:hypothetical protein